MSVCRIQINLVISAPQALIAARWGVNSLFVETKRADNRISPYLPNFSKMAARIIDPATGASTCAFGSHRWVKYRGIFTRNAVITVAHQISFDSGISINIVWFL